MKKILVVFLGLILIGSVVLPVFAQTSTSATTSTTTPTSTQQLVDTLKALIENLKKQILELQAKIQAMRQAQTQVREQTQNVQDTLKDIRDLKKGMTSEEIKAIQQILASDPDIYPEGTISGYYGPLTEKALKRFREKYGIKDEDKEDREDRIGQKTLEKLSELLEKNRVIKLEDGRKCVIVPPGHLVAPGLMKKSTTTPSIPECQTLPKGIEKLLKLRVGGWIPATSTPTSNSNQTSTQTSNTTSTNSTSTQNTTTSTTTSTTDTTNTSTVTSTNSTSTNQ
jgi:peptidoglycan hydrolase-like protein with peptidoglycan-binding domain